MSEAYDDPIRQNIVRVEAGKNNQADIIVRRQRRNAQGAWQDEDRPPAFGALQAGERQTESLRRNERIVIEGQPEH